MKRIKSPAFVFLLIIPIGFLLGQNPGDLDLSFNGTGYRIDTSIHSETPYAIEAMQDGRIVVGGIRDDGNSTGFMVRRYHADGRPDTTLGHTGMVQISGFDLGSGRNDLAVQSDGKVLLIGTKALSDDVIVTRLLANGDLDTSFADSGVFVVNTPFGGYAYGNEIFVRPSGKIVFTLLYYGGFLESVAVYRLLSDGSPDQSYGSNGIASNSTVNEILRINASEMLADGSVVIAGAASTWSNQSNFLAKFDPQGNIDQGFGPGGSVSMPFTAFDGDVWAIAVDPLGNSYVTGYRFNSPLHLEVAVRKLNALGQFDTDYGQGGQLVIAGNSLDYASSALELDSQGNLLIGGTVAGTNSDFLLARALPDGRLDSTFGTDGWVAHDLGQVQSEALGMAIQPDGRVLLKGYSVPDGFGSSTATARIYTGTTVALANHDPLTKFSFGPNPCFNSGDVTIESALPIRLQISIYSNQGQRLREIHAPASLSPGRHEFPVDLSSLPSGIYHLMIDTQNEHFTLPIIKVAW